MLIPTILSLTASEAAQESEGPELRFESEADYIGPVFDDDALRQRQGRRESSAGLIDVYNAWTSFQKVNLKSNLVGGTIPCTVTVPGLGLWLLNCSGPPTDIRPGFYKVTSVHTVTSGGSGNGKETASFDVLQTLPASRSQVNRNVLLPASSAPPSGTVRRGNVHMGSAFMK